jgi:hypothetical protein
MDCRPDNFRLPFLNCLVLCFQLRKQVSGINIGLLDKIRLFGNVTSMFVKLFYAFVWAEFAIAQPAFIFLPETMLLGAKLVPLLNGLANLANSYTYYEQSFQVRSSDYIFKEILRAITSFHEEFRDTFYNIFNHLWRNNFLLSQIPSRAHNEATPCVPMHRVTGKNHNPHFSPGLDPRTTKSVLSTLPSTTAYNQITSFFRTV